MCKWTPVYPKHWQGTNKQMDIDHILVETTQREKESTLVRGRSGNTERNQYRGQCVAEERVNNINSVVRTQI
ncbi:hypothetical protein BOW25_13340 [Solemya velum gill symbiont]|nr:hypothetical protein BOW25_13340 [Solemya velum gill symbiont]